MRAFITHDDAGNVSSIVVPAEDLEQGDIELVEASGKGIEDLRIAEVDIAEPADRGEPARSAASPSDSLFASLVEVRTNQKLDAKTRQLVRKP